LDQNRDQKKDRRQKDKHQQRTHDIKAALDKLLLYGKAAVAEQQKRRIKHVYFLRAHDHNIGYFWQAVAPLIIFKTTFQKEVSLMRRDIPDHDCTVFRDLPFDLFDSF